MIQTEVGPLIFYETGVIATRQVVVSQCLTLWATRRIEHLPSKQRVTGSSPVGGIFERVAVVYEHRSHSDCRYDLIGPDNGSPSIP